MARKRAPFRFNEADRVLPVADLMKIYMKPAIDAIRRKLEKDLLNHHKRFTLLEVPNDEAKG